MQDWENDRRRPSGEIALVVVVVVEFTWKRKFLFEKGRVRRVDDDGERAGDVSVSRNPHFLPSAINFWFDT